MINLFTGPLILFLLFPFINIFAVKSAPEIEELLQSGKDDFNNNNFVQALITFNRAMGYLREVPKSNPLVKDIEQHIRLTKGKLLVQRYNKNLNKENEINGNALLPISEESEDIEVNQIFGPVLAREVWQNKKINMKGDSLGFGRRVTVLPSAGVELSYVDGYKYKIRSVEAASFAMSDENVFDFHSGSFSLASLESNSLCLIKSPLSEFHLKSDDPFAVLFAVTTNGGLKIIGLLGEIELVQKTKPSISLRPGQLIFSMPDGFSRKMSVELSTLMVTSKLMTAFEDPPNFYRKLKQQALIQALRTKKRFRTLVGDAKTNSDFQIKVLESE
jgi:hypothetical protein